MKVETVKVKNEIKVIQKQEVSFSYIRMPNDNLLFRTIIEFLRKKKYFYSQCNKEVVTIPIKKFEEFTKENPDIWTVNPCPLEPYYVVHKFNTVNTATVIDTEIEENTINTVMSMIAEFKNGNFNFENWAEKLNLEFSEEH